MRIRQASHNAANAPLDDSLDAILNTRFERGVERGSCNVLKFQLSGEQTELGMLAGPGFSPVRDGKH